MNIRRLVVLLFSAVELFFLFSVPKFITSNLVASVAELPIMLGRQEIVILGHIYVGDLINHLVKRLMCYIYIVNVLALS